jgi:hypothetical protein
LQRAVIPIALFLAAFLVRVVVAMGYPDPAYPDSFYYTNLGRELAAGNGLQIDYIWNFVDVGGRIPDQGTLPIPSNAHWMPLAALIQLPFLEFFGVNPVGHGMAFWIIGALVAPLTYFIGRDAGFGKLASVGGGALAAAPGAVTQFMGQPDNFALFMPLGALALWLCGRGLRGGRRSFALGGLVVGLATLSRNDGILLGVPFALAFVGERLERWDEGHLSERIDTIGWRAAITCVLGFLLVAGPWYARQFLVFGSLSPSAQSGRILFIRDYNELWSATGATNVTSFLAQGLEAFVISRAGGLAMALVIFAGLPLLLYLVPFTLAGWWRERQNRLVRPWVVYAVTLFVFSALLFAVHVPFGTFLHSAVALVPHAYLLAMVGIWVVVSWVARRRRHWDVERATRVFTLAAVVITTIMALGSVWRGEGNWRHEAEMRAPIIAALERTPTRDRVMSPDAGAYRYHAGRPGIVTPNDPIAVVYRALRDYDIRWLVLERAHMVPSLRPILAGDKDVSWLSDPVVVVPAEGTDSATAGDSGPPMPEAALYAVCLEPDDPRCRP